MSGRVRQGMSFGLGAAPVLLWRGVAGAAPRPETGWGLPRDVSMEGHRVDDLLQVTAVLVGLLMLVTVVWMGLVLVRHRRAHLAQYDHGNTTRQVLGVLGLVVLIFGVVDGHLFVTSSADLDDAFWNFSLAEGSPDAVRIEINAHQWAWDARYAGADGQFATGDDIVTLNDIRVPSGVPVIFQLRSVDVIHSMYLPNFRQKVDVVPGNTTHLWLSAKETGQFDIACAEHCGVNHYKMRGQLTVYEPEEYRAWLEVAQGNARIGYDAADTEGHWGWPWDTTYF